MKKWFKDTQNLTEDKMGSILLCLNYSLKQSGTRIIGEWMAWQLQQQLLNVVKNNIGQ